MTQIFRTAAAALPPAQRGLNPQLGIGESNSSGMVLSSICCQLHLLNSDGTTPGELSVDVSHKRHQLSDVEVEAIIRALKRAGYSVVRQQCAGSQVCRLAISW